jgi:hypothetical protein
MNQEETLKELVRLQEGYITLIGSELNATAPFASNRGWRSKNFEAGALLRTKIKELKEKLNNFDF